jgi:prepilin peptidase CpaA
MWTDPTSNLMLLILCAPICLHMAYTDLRDMKILNRDVSVILGLFVICAPFLMPATEWIARLAWALPTLRGFMGAGDAKILTALTPFAAGRESVMLMAIMAIMILVMIPLHRVVRAFPALRPGLSHWRSWEHPGFPMGVVIGPSFLLFLLLINMNSRLP